MVQQLTPAQRQKLAEHTRDVMLREGHPPDDIEFTYQMISSGQVDKFVLEDLETEEAPEENSKGKELSLIHI